MSQKNVQNKGDTIRPVGERHSIRDSLHGVSPESRTLGDVMKKKEILFSVTEAVRIATIVKKTGSAPGGEILLPIEEKVASLIGKHAIEGHPRGHDSLAAEIPLSRVSLSLKEQEQMLQICWKIILMIYL
ncbi:hypothetical protein CAPTEDRAFT_226067 [Capitella teleta]|uniref:Uncharacterized protein n=1 Tax=Capitella teleta TaxID=283909 RepID=R7UYJ3_CAPTE|nr:hypothetical protein CAPTEDRAFT_226067 [Capitella teleta]|eukprot:ELU08496.1 hypothetical protein CAPTEDRAFT_226067 [Capitella teleta]